MRFLNFKLIILSILFCATSVAKSDISDSIFRRSKQRVSLTEKIRGRFNWVFDASIVGFGAVSPGVGIVGGLGALSMKTLYDLERDPLPIKFSGQPSLALSSGIFYEKVASGWFS